MELSQKIGFSKNENRPALNNSYSYKYIFFNKALVETTMRYLTILVKNPIQTQILIL